MGSTPNQEWADTEFKLDRKLQLKILLQLRKHYPGRVDFKDVQNFGNEQDPVVLKSVAGNMFYLEKHGLVTFTSYPAEKYVISGDIGRVTITAQGLDLLADDGGIECIYDARQQH